MQSKMKALGIIVTVATAFTGPAIAADAAHPSVVELFQSQGCSSCPPANENVMALADRPDVLTLSFQVTYWDYLGWKDSFASPRYTARQWDYARRFHRDEVGTPQVVVNGSGDVIGNRRDEIEALLRRADRGGGGPEISAHGPTVSVGTAAGAYRAQVWLVRYDPHILQVPIRRGENGGRTLPHRNVVKELVSLGEWSGAAQDYSLPAPGADGLAAAILVQDGPGGPILGATRL
jgi:hypothetical protein